MEPLLIHCMFMLSCFGGPLTGSANELFCPAGCNCFSAAPDGITGNNSFSFICDGADPLYKYTSFRTKQINTLVTRLSDVYSNKYTSGTKAHSMLSFILEDCQLGDVSEKQNIFQFLDTKFLKHLTILNTTLTGINWSILKDFKHLQTVYIDGATLPSIDETFASIGSNIINTIVIKQSKLSHIDREAFSGKESSLQRLIISENDIHNFIWLSANNRVWPELWYLDLRDNKLTYLPIDLASSLPNLRILYLALNNFKYMSYLTLKPWLGLSELMLAAENTNKLHSSEKWLRIYYDENMANLREIFEGRATGNVDSFPAFLLESFLSDLRYDCLLSKKVTTGTATWTSLINCNNRMYTYLPDNLFLDPNGQLTIGKPVSTTDILAAVNIEGIDLNSALTASDKSEFYLDSITNIAQYRAARKLIVTQLNDATNGNSIRINLFSKRTLNYVTENGQISRQEIILMTDFMEDLLTTAEQMKKYIMLVMWKFEDIDFAQLDVTVAITQQTFHRQLDVIINPMLTRIASLPALIGIEILSGYLNNMVLIEPTATSCELGYDRALQLLGESAVHVKQYTKKNKILGVNIDANCQYCLHAAMMQSCRDKMKFNDQYGFDFISISSKLKSVTAEFYSYKNWAQNKPPFFTALTLEPNPKQPAKPIKPGVFYVLHDDGNAVDVHQAKLDMSAFASGVFVAPEKSSNLNLLEETIVRKN